MINYLNPKYEKIKKCFKMSDSESLYDSQDATLEEELDSDWEPEDDKNEDPDWTQGAEGGWFREWSPLPEGSDSDSDSDSDSPTNESDYEDMSPLEDWSS